MELNSDTNALVTETALDNYLDFNDVMTAYYEAGDMVDFYIAVQNLVDDKDGIF